MPQKKKCLGSAPSQTQIWWPSSSIRNAIFPPVGAKLSLAMPNILPLWYLWAACGRCMCVRVWHYSSFKYRILDCLTGSNFIMPQSQTGGDKSQRRASHNLSRLRDKTRLRQLSLSTKLGRAKEVLNVKAGVFCFVMSTLAPLPPDIFSLECCDAI